MCYLLLYLSALVVTGGQDNTILVHSLDMDVGGEIRCCVREHILTYTYLFFSFLKYIVHVCHQRSYGTLAIPFTGQCWLSQTRFSM